MNENNEVSGILSIQNQFKKIQEVIIDNCMELVNTKLENLPTENANVDLITKKLKSLGNSDAFILAETLKKFELVFQKSPIQNIKETFNEKKLKNNKEYQMFSLQNIENLKKLSKTPCMTWKMKSSVADSKRLEITEIGFNYKFIEYVSEHRSNFVDFLIKKGFPDCIHTQENYFKFINIMVNKTFLQNKIKESDLNCFLTSNHLPKLAAKLKFEMNCFQTENYA